MGMTDTMKGFTKISAGNYRHAETGIEIRKVPAHREYGYAVGVRWQIIVPEIAGSNIYSGAKTLKDAIEWATESEWSFVARMRARIAADWGQAKAGETLVDSTARWRG